MNRDFERSPTTPVGATESVRKVADRAAERVRGWFRGRDEGKFDTALPGFPGASLQLQSAGEQAPMDSPGKVQLGRAPGGLRSSTIVSEGLEQALSGVAGEFTPADSVRLRVFVIGQPAALPPSIQEQVYLIGREALLNAMRHSEATSIEAEIEYLPRCLSVVVRDNGRGIDPHGLRLGKDAHRGLRGMRQRAESLGAQLRIWSRPGAGTEVEISVPRRIAAFACA